MMGEIHELATNYGAELRLARVKPEVMVVLRADAIGEDHIYGNVYESVADLIPAASAG